MRPSAGTPSVGGKEKTQKLQFCVGEAIREKDFSFLNKAHVVWLGRDQRHGRLLVRFRAVGLRNGEIDVMTGVLGQAKDFGTGALALNDATKNVARRLVLKASAPERCGRNLSAGASYLLLRPKPPS